MSAVPKKIIELVKRKQIILSGKARRQADKGRVDIDDLINSILHGNVIKKERDEQKVTHYKYTIIGPSHSGIAIYSCGKVVRLIEKEYFIITFHEVR